MSEIANNRKKTLGRNFVQVQIKNIIGFTVKVLHGSPNYKKHQFFTKFVAVIPPKIKVDSKLPTKQIKRIKLKAWHKQISLAHKEANVVADKQPFDCIILTKELNTSLKITRN